MAKWFNHRTWLQYQKDIKVKRGDDLDMYLPHVLPIANTFPRHSMAIGCLDINDLIQAGNKGLVEAWKKVDHSRDQPEIWSFIKKRIKFAIRQEIDVHANMIKIPQREIRKARESLTALDKVLVNVFPSFFDDELWTDPEPVSWKSLQLEEIYEKVLREHEDNYRDIEIYFKLMGIGQEKITAKECAENYNMSEPNVKKIKNKINKIVKSETFAKKVQKLLSDYDICTNITYEGMKTITERLNNTNESDYSNKTTGDFRRQLDKDITYDTLRVKNWESESNYFNYYYKKPKGNMIKC